MTKSTKWLDILAVTVSIAIIGLSAIWLIYSGAFTIILSQDEKLSWHLVRSSGLVAYILLVVSTVWGLFISSQFVKDWSPGPVSLTMHSTISWLSVLVALVHALLLLLDSYYSYTLGDIFIPFRGPYRPEFVGLGTLAFWLMILISISFPLQKYLGNRNWKYLHYTSYIGFGLVSLHGLFAGTDGSHLGFRVLVGIAVMLVLFLLGIRLGKDQAKAAVVRPNHAASKTRVSENQ
jgi:methionine sulfoxide reductase heme-binding subunit